MKNNALHYSPIGPSTGQHLVDPDDMEWMQSHPDVELILPAILYQVFIGTDTACFQSFRAELFILVRNEMDAKREIIYSGLLLAQIEDADLGVWYTTTETRLWIGLVFAVAIAVE